VELQIFGIAVRIRAVRQAFFTSIVGWVLPAAEEEPDQAFDERLLGWASGSNEELIDKWFIINTADKI
jgi:hypothetical protein